MGSGGAPIGAYLSLGAQALTPIIIGSFSSLKTPKALRRRLRQKRKGKAPQKDAGEEEDSEDDEEEVEHLTLTDSLMFPVLGSIALLSLYFLLKFVGQDTINLLIGGYFGFLGIFAVQNTSTILLRYIQHLLSITPKIYHLRLSSHSNPSHMHQKLTIPTLMLLPLSIALPPLYIYLGKPWYLTNVLGLAFSQGAIQMLKLDSFKTGAALLVGLFFYDIFWVFGTPVMVTVAKGLDAPIKILAPKGSSNDFALLGLGDIVVPGLVVALCLRYDYARANRGTQIEPHQSFPKPFFYIVLAAYILGLTTTVVVMHTFQAAQPALLYLSPACVGAPLLLAVVKGQLKDLWSWVDEDATGDTAKADSVTTKSE